jgi:hypothetical protein
MERYTKKAAEQARSKPKTQIKIVQSSPVSSMRGMSAYVKPVCGRPAAEVRRDNGGLGNTTWDAARACENLPGKIPPRMRKYAPLPWQRLVHRAH